jgi:hypothetical protein
MKGHILAASAIVLGAAAEVSGVKNEIFSLVTFPLSKDVGVLQSLRSKYYKLMALQPDLDLEPAISAGTPDVLLPGVYRQTGAWAFGAGRSLIFEGTSSDIWIIQIIGAASLGGAMVLDSDVVASNIVW